MFFCVCVCFLLGFFSGIVVVFSGIVVVFVRFFLV